MIDRMDQWLIDKIFQRIVDWSQRDGGWWVRELAFFSIILTIVRGIAGSLGWIHDTRSVPGLSIDIIAGLLFFWWARDKVRVASLGTANWWRKYFMIFTPIFLPLDIWRHPFNVPLDLVFPMFYYFAACRPPKPREKHETKPKLAFNN